MKLLLSDRIGNAGSISGYEQLVRVASSRSDFEIVQERTGVLDMLIGTAYATVRGWPHRNPHHAAAEFRLSRRLCHPDIEFAHILAGELHLPFFDAALKSPRNLVATLHLPPRQWDGKMLQWLGHLSSALVLYRSDIGFFEKHIGKNRVRFVPLGVRTDFFSPLEENREFSHPRVLFAGRCPQNTEMLFRVITRLHKRSPDLQFDLLVPERLRTRPGLVELHDHPAVRWHADVSEEQLRELYRNSYLHLLPLNDRAAGDSIVESLACGTPVVTTDVSGIRDYGGGTAYPIVPNDDDNAMIQLVELYLNDRERRETIAKASRKFAEQHLSWPVAAEKHFQACRDLAAP